MTLKQLIKLENSAKEVWVITPSLHYDIENKIFSELVSVNLGQATKYRYILPATPQIEKNLIKYKQLYNVTENDIKANFLLLPPSEFTSFLPEIAIYNASSNPIAVAAPPSDDSNEVIEYKPETAKQIAKTFVTIWKRYKRSKP